MMSKHPVHLTPLPEKFTPCFGNLQICDFNFDALAQGSDFESKGDKLYSPGHTKALRYVT